MTFSVCGRACQGSTSTDGSYAVVAAGEVASIDGERGLSGLVFLVEKRGLGEILERFMHGMGVRQLL